MNPCPASASRSSAAAASPSPQPRCHGPARRSPPRSSGFGSGGAEGIDTLARTIAAEHGYTIKHGTFIEHLPAVRAWAAPDGFRDRNVRIVLDSTHLLALCCARSRTHGAAWTAREAARQGRTVWLRTI